MSDRSVILVADDSSANRLIVRTTLKDGPYEVIEASNGREAVDTALQRLPELILMDLMMPELDGLEATQELKKYDETARIPVLMLTSLDETEDRVRAFEAGATGFLNKPFDRMELLAHVRSYVNLSQINRKYVLSTVNHSTGLPNRAAYQEAVSEFEQPWLFLLNMDNIDSIRKFYGEPRARDMILEYAQYLRHIIAETDSARDGRLFHLSPGVLGVLLDDTDGSLDRENALSLGRGLHAQLRDYEVHKENVQWESDFTVVVSSERSLLLEQAELALSEAMGARRNVVYAQDFAEDAYRSIENNLKWLGLIRQALTQDRFVTYYQPIIDINTGEIDKYEALLRMLDDDGKPISPGEFLLVAKNSKYYGEITRRVFDLAVREFMDRPEGVSVNLSVLDIEHSTTRDHILMSLQEHPELARRITLEIVEQEGLQRYEQVKEFVDEAKSLGARIALDDFGSGYSNFVRILDLDVDYVKIDGSIIGRICDQGTMLRLVEGIKSFVSPNNIQLVAEFVENGEILKRLRELGVEYGQGYYFGRPSPRPESVLQVSGRTGST